MQKPRIAFQTFGCKLNFSETSTLSRKFREQGYIIVEHKEEAEVYVIHSCSVTGNAEKKCRAAIRQAKKRNPKATVAVIGCFAQVKPDELSAMKEADLILGNHEKYNLTEHLDIQLHATGKKERKILSSPVTRTKAFMPAYSSGDRTRSFLKIQDGCDYYCSYCIIPLARGRSRSGTIKATIQSAREIARTGAKEIILTGVNIGDFGKLNGESLTELMKQMDQLENIERIRLSSIEPDLLSTEMIKFIAASGKFLPHFHIPLQSGSEKILKSMNRKYDTGLFAEKVSKIREHMPLACIAADVIAGFPGETEKEFEETYDFIQNLDISYLHVFTYSSRPGTKASKLGNSIPGKVKHERSIKLQRLSDDKKEKFYKKNIGQEAHVLFESADHDGFMTGFTENYLRVKTKYDENLVNKIVKLRLDLRDDEGIFMF